MGNRVPSPAARPVGWCLALVLCVAFVAACGGGGEARPGDVVLLILDTTRADHLSTYGYARATTPNLDRLAADGERYDSAWAQSCWTLPAVSTILTGQPPHVHGAGRSATGLHPLREGVVTLAQRLAGAGYRTAAFMNVIWCAPNLSGIDRGFDEYDFHTSDESNVGQRDARETTTAALDWVAGEGDAPVFLVVHYFDPHLTYDPPAPYDTMFDEGDGARIPRGFGSTEQVFQVRKGELRLDAGQRRSLVARYDGEIRFVDEEIGRLREGLERMGRWDSALVIVVGDHGEEFWDHGGFEHGHSHHRELMRVPLIVRQPHGDPGVVRRGRVRQLDIAPTVLDFAGLPAADELPGRVLGIEGSPYAVAEGSLWAGDLVSVRSDDGTVIERRDTGDLRYYLPDDPFETAPLTDRAKMPAALLDLLDSLPVPTEADQETRTPTPDQLDRLRSLGYVQ